VGCWGNKKTKSISLPTRLNQRKHRFTKILFLHIGRTRLEPIIIIILSIVMCAASFQVIFEGVRSIIEDVGYFRNVSGYAYEKPPVDINPAAISIMCITIVIKIILSVLCYRISTPTMSALAADHRNDVVATVVALIFGIIGKIFKFLSKFFVSLKDILLRV
jgi:divalent metal cation (Fe/Co/Zn/Cd) transporter